MQFIIPWIMTVPKGTNLLSAYDSRGLFIYLLVVFCKNGALSARYIVFIAHTFILDLSEGLQIKRCLVSKVLSYKNGEVFKSYEIQ